MIWLLGLLTEGTDDVANQTWQHDVAALPNCLLTLPKHGSMLPDCAQMLPFTLPSWQHQRS
jgi:hypothetical protein